MNDTMRDHGREMAAVNTCVERIIGLVKLAIPDATVEITNMEPDSDRIDLLARLMGKPLSQSFVLREECLKAWAEDPGRCRPIDSVAISWISVLKIKRADTRSWRRVSSKLENPKLPHAST